MKVRHKQHYPGMVWECEGETPNFYVGKLTDSWQSTELLPKESYEPVPTETWRDISSECVEQGAAVRHEYTQEDGQAISMLCTPQGGYRLRKVQAIILGPDSFIRVQKPGQMLIRQDAFIVEKREP